MAYSFEVPIQASGIIMKAGDFFKLHVTELYYAKFIACNNCGGQCENCRLSKEFCLKIEMLFETIAEEPPLNKKDRPYFYKVKTDMDLVAFHIYTLYLLKDIVCTQICKENCLLCFLRIKDRCCKVLNIFHHRFDGCVINGEQIS
jgi:hypothetical protein